MYTVVFKTVEFESPEYKETVALRELLLRKPLGLEFSNEELQLEKSMYHLGYFHDDSCIACLVLVPEKNNRIKMRQVAVATAFQSKGIGRKLVLDAEEFAVKQDFGRIYCHARETALDFYKKLNYHVSGDLFEEVGIPHYKLEKKLRI